MAHIPAVYTIKIAPVSGTAERGTPDSIKQNGVTKERPHDQVEEEYSLNLTRAETRNATFKNILLNKRTQDISILAVGYGFSGAFLGLLAVSVLTFVPVHDIIIEPTYWCELMHPSFVYLGILAGFTLVTGSCWLNVSFIQTKKNYMALFCILSITSMIFVSSTYLIWTYLLGLRYPMPFQGQICAYTMIFASCVTLWFQVPFSMRNDAKFRCRLKFFFLAYAFNFLIAIEYQGLSKIMTAVPPSYQFIVAIFLPIVREVNLRVQTKIAFKASGCQDSSVKITCIHNVNTRHSLFLAIVMGSTTSLLTSVVIIGIDFAINIFFYLQLVWLKRKYFYNDSRMQEAAMILLMLVIVETEEFMLPFTYFLCFLMAYYGPNGDKIGNVRNGYWQYTAVTDVSHTIQNLGMFLSFYLLSGIGCSLLLWKFIQINVLRTYAYLQKEFWLIMAVNTSYTLTTVGKPLKYYLKLICRYYCFIKSIPNYNSYPVP